MKRLLLVFLACCSGRTGAAAGEEFDRSWANLIDVSCIHCHDTAESPLDMTKLQHDLTERRNFDTWQRMYDRLHSGEMPPDSEPRPDDAIRDKALASLKQALVDANRAARGQRTPLRRLTRLEYAYTIRDLLGIDEAIALELCEALPAEADSGGFDTVAVNQSMSPLHVRSYLAAADQALAAALPGGPRPQPTRFKANYVHSFTLRYIAQTKGLGLGIVKKLDDAYAAFFDFGATYTFHSASEGFQVRAPGRYRVAVEAYPYQAKSPVVLTVYQGKMQGIVASLDVLLGSFDLTGDQPRTEEMTPYLRPGDVVGPGIAELDGNPHSALRSFNPSDGYDMTNYKGEGIAFKSLSIEGPIVETWPPESTRRLLKGMEFTESGEPRLTKDPMQHIVDVLSEFAPQAFRRPLVDGELEAYASLGRRALDDGRPFIEAIRVPLRAILTAPSFLYHASGDGERLDDYAFASRLSYFLWRSMPDRELLDAARDGRLSDSAVLRAQVDRMIGDLKSERFVKDFAGQAFRLYDLRANTPDPGLFPEYDDRLGQAMGRETEMFLHELIASNCGAGSLIDADFTFLNRRLAQHYGIAGIEGQEMRKVPLPPESPRGGLLTQASILKVTANGTTTSPVPRGNFVLARLLGQPAPPPPEGIGNLEPDTRGTTTVREQLDAHRSTPQCATCHRRIDPPGFALESFDPIGGFRTHYRVSGGNVKFGDFTVPAPYRKGLPVDPSGITAQGQAFSGIDEFKQLLLAEKTEQVARHVVSQFVAFATGAEIAFADRDDVEAILERTRAYGYPLRDLVHEVVRSDLFRQR